MVKHCMVDLETMAVSPNAVILSLGAVQFNPFGEGHDNEIYFRINLDDQDQLGREIDENTLNWWSKQDPEIIEEAFNPNDRIPLEEAMERFRKFAWGCQSIWSHGASFDIVILENIFNQIKKPVPWNFWQIRDTRTIFDLGINPMMPNNSKHDALQDAIRQSIGVQNVYSKLGIRLK